jgi:hypothetical protein
MGDNIRMNLKEMQGVGLIPLRIGIIGWLLCM